MVALLTVFVFVGAVGGFGVADTVMTHLLTRRPEFDEGNPLLRWIRRRWGHGGMMATMVTVKLLLFAGAIGYWIHGVHLTLTVFAVLGVLHTTWNVSQVLRGRLAARRGPHAPSDAETH